MKVETPRTDAMVRKILSDLQSGTMEIVHADFARKLELESERRRIDILRWVHRCESLQRKVLHSESPAVTSRRAID
jgi:hypothetical protein